MLIMANVDEIVLEEVVKAILASLKPIELDRLQLVACRRSQEYLTTACRRDVMTLAMHCELWTCGHRKDAWVELLYLMKCVAFLPQVSSCEAAARQQVQKKAFYPLHRRLLLKVFDNLTITREEELRCHIAKLSHTKELDIAMEAVQLLLCFADIHDGDNAVKQLQQHFKELNWDGLVGECQRYLDVVEENSLIYKMDKVPVGKCLIVNNSFRNDGRLRRNGSAKDEKLLTSLFKSFGFDVETNSLTRAELIDKLNCIAKEDHGDCCAFVCCLMSHGYLNGIWGEDLKPIDIVLEVIDIISKCSTLKGKPKIFFVQSCRSNHLPVVNNEPQVFCSADQDSFRDILVNYATIKGGNAILTTRGSPYITKLVEIALECYCYNDHSKSNEVDLKDILVKVNNEFKKCILPITKEVVQVPVHWSTLTKKVRFKFHKEVIPHSVA